MASFPRRFLIVGASVAAVSALLVAFAYAGQNGITGGITTGITGRRATTPGTRRA